MNGIAKVVFCFMVCAIGLFLYHPAASACQVDEFYLTKAGYLAASTPEKLNEAISYQEKNDQEHLAVMVRNGTVISLEGEVKVQVKERSIEHMMLKIKFPDKDISYWVKDGALKQIKCTP